MASIRLCNRVGNARRRRNQQRAAKFKSRQETLRRIKLIDVYGNIRYINQRGKLSVTKHHSVLNVLEKRALRFQESGCYEDLEDEALLDEALDKTRTVTTAGESLSDSDNDNSIDNDSLTAASVIC